MPFQDAFGHERPIGLLRKALLAGAVSHAYLFYGPEGIGKKLVALNFAQALNCAQGTDDACGQCRSCRNVRNGNHPDFLFLEPEGGNIRIEEIRRIQKALGYKSYEGGWKVALVDGCEEMSREAANCFLKTLEEPPDRTVIILICSNYLRLLPTINSRCQRIRFSPLQESRIQDILIRDRGFEPEKARAASVLADGSLGRALSMDYEAALELRNQALDLIRGHDSRQISDLFALDKKFDKKKQEAVELLHRMRGLIRDISVFHLTGDKDSVKNKDIISRIADLSGKLRPEACQGMFDLVTGALYSLQANTNVALTLDNLFIKLRDPS